MICDVQTYTCFVANGACNTSSDCPPLADSLVAVAMLACESGYCRLQARPSTPIDDLSGTSTVSVTSLAPGQSFATADEVRFSWAGADAAGSLVLVLDEPVLYKSQVAEHAVWGIVRAAQQDRTATVAEGHVIENGVWQPGPGQLPAGQALYFIAQLVELEILKGTSPIVPFTIGSGWPEPGTSCDAEDSVDSCANPARPQLCRGGACRVACASHLDCTLYGLGCGLFQSGVRVCE